MNYWLLKTEPSCWSWSQQLVKGTEPWDGVRNAQAQKNMRAMKKGDEVFFYHTGTERQIIGIVTIVREAYPDSTDEMGRFDRVDVKTKSPLQRPVPLKAIKAHPGLQHLALLRQGRLSVVPIDEASWRLILDMSVDKTV